MACRAGLEPEADVTRAPSVAVGVALSGSGLNEAGLWVVLVIDVLDVSVVVVQEMACVPCVRRCRMSLGGMWRAVGAVAVARQARMQVAETARRVIMVAWLCVCVWCRVGCEGVSEWAYRHVCVSLQGRLSSRSLSGGRSGHKRLGTKRHAAPIAPVLRQSMRKRLDKRTVGWRGCAALALSSSP